MILKFKCETCLEEKTILTEIKVESLNCSLSHQMVRNYGNVSANKTEKIDPGWQVKAVEYDAEKNELHRQEGDAIIAKLAQRE